MNKIKIKQDTLKFNIDKQVHLGISFGMYYFLFTYTSSIVVSLLLSILVGLCFEVYQGYSKHHSGYSHIDMLYNVVGILSAFILHGVLYLIYE